MTSATMQQVVLAAYPRGNPRPTDFRLETVPLPVPGEGEILLRTLWLALDPLIRFALDETPLSGATHVRIGEPVYGPTVSQVVASNHPGYAVGDIVEGRTGWREYAVVAPDRSDYRGPPRKVDPALAPVQTALGALGMPAQTAYTGMVDTGRVRAGETVAISAAAGAVGSLAGQIGKALGARVIGIAGGPAKCRALRDLGFDAAVDYKAPDFAEQLAQAAPDGIDLYFDNTGGEVTLTVMRHLRRGGRMAVCGFIAYYGMGMEGPGPDRLPGFFRMINARQLEIRGFAGLMASPEALPAVVRWYREGRIRAPETVVDGLAAAGDAFAGVFTDNSFVGKLLVRVSDPA